MATMHYPVTFIGPHNQRLVVYLDNKGGPVVVDQREVEKGLWIISSDIPVLRRALEKANSETAIIRALKAYGKGVYDPMPLDAYMDDL